MKGSKQRIKDALMRKKTDIVPVVSLFTLEFLIEQLNIPDNSADAFIEDPVSEMIAYQEEINHDPLIFLYTDQEIGAKRWHNSYINALSEANSSWTVKETLDKTEAGLPLIKKTFSTPSGTLTSLYRKDRFMDWVIEYPIKSETDSKLLAYRPDPKFLDYSKLKQLVSQHGDEVFIMFGVSGVWQEACALRGLEKMVYDLYDRPQWAINLFETLCDYTCRIVSNLGKYNLDCIMLNESQLGVGISRDIYVKYIKQYDDKIVAQINKTGALSSYHICGLCSSLLEDMAESGATCIEPLAPKEYSGDVELKDAARRVGSKAGLWGGFKERVLCKDKDAVKKEVLRCISETAGTGYVLRGSGVVFEAKKENLMLLREFSK